MALTFKTVRIDYLSYESLCMERFDYSECTVDYAIANHEQYLYGRIITVTAIEPTASRCEFCYKPVKPAPDPKQSPACEDCKHNITEPIADVDLTKLAGWCALLSTEPLHPN